MSEARSGGAGLSGPPKARGRRSLSNVGGVADIGGDADAGAMLAYALDVESAPEPTPERGKAARAARDPDRVHVHGFHSYPARMHPDTAARLVAAFAPAPAVVLDPFCGGGTVLVEAMHAGRHAVGVDLNPLAVLLSRAKTRPRSDADREQLAATARDVRTHADERRKARAGATRRYPQADVDLFDPHVLLELDGVRAGIEEVRDEALRSDLWLVLSAILGKLSKRQGDTSEQLVPRRLAAGYPAKLFQRKAEEFAACLDDFERTLPSPRPTVRVAVDDATQLRTVRSGAADVIITSPPYVSTYDYVEHHAMRLRWLGLKMGAFESGELGARRRFQPLGAEAAREAWLGELQAFFRASERALKRGGALILIMGDSAIGSEPLRADEMVATVASSTRLSCVARASQARPHFHKPTREAFRDSPRAEHALLLVKSSS